MSELEVTEIAKVQKIDIQDGDVLVAYIKGAFPVEVLKGMERHLIESFLPKKIKVLILNEDCARLEVLRAE